MNLLRLLLFVAALWLVWRVYRQIRGQLEPPRDSRDASFEPMARCAKCGTYLPAHALGRNGRCGRCNE